jgi:flagellar biosynthesis protein FlhF
MIYKTFKAPTYKEAVLKAKMEMGTNVYIIGRKEVKEGGFLGLFAKTMLEIIVAKNEDKENRLSKNTTTTKNSQTESILQAASAIQKKLLTSQVESSSSEDGTILRELKEIKTRPERVTDIKDKEKERPYLDKLIHILNANDFSGDFIQQLRKKFEDELTLKEVQNPKILEEKFKGYLMNSIDTSGPVELGQGKPSVVVLVGPTGVGKTTTIAKLAATYGVIQKKKVELVTIDSYRIAAIEQLGKYAELMQIPFTVVNTREEFKIVIMNSKSEIIFVDTAGRSQKNNLGLAEMRNILDGAKSNLDIHLVLSATTKYRDAVDIITRFNQLMYNKVIITKLDETNTIGSVLSIMNPEKKLSYFTNGQGVPDDIEIADKEKLFEMIAFEELCAG